VVTIIHLSALGFHTAHCFCDYSSTHEQIIKFFPPGSGLDKNSLFWPVLGTRTSPGGNHLTYHINPPPTILVSVPITRIDEFKKKEFSPWINMTPLWTRIPLFLMTLHL